MRGVGTWQNGGVALVIVLAVVLPGIGVGAQPATAAPTTDADTDVAFAYLANGNVTLVTEAGEEIDMGVTAEIAGSASDFDEDGYVEVPYVTSQNELYTVDRTGNTTMLASNVKPSKVAVGDRDGDGNESVFFVDADGVLRAASPGGSVRQIVNPSDSLVAVGGVNDVTGDGVSEVVYTSGSAIRYYNETSNDTVIWTSGVGSSGTAVGTPRNFDGTGGARVPFVDGSNNVRLVDAAGNAVTLAGGAAKAPVAGVNWTGSSTPEVLYFNNSGTAKYATVGGTTGTVADSDGNAIAAPTDADKSAGLAWAQDADAPLVLANFTVENQSGTLNVSFDSNEALQAANVTIDGPDGTVLSLGDFNETESGDGYSYAGDYAPSADGNYTGTLESATAVDGDTADPDDTDTATIDTRFNVTDLNATASGLDVNVSFNATEQLSDVAVEISGAENTTLGLDAFSASGSSPYVYTGTYNSSSEGTHNVTLTEATSEDGQTDDENLTDSATTNVPLAVSNFTLTNWTDGIRVAFDATERLSETTVSIVGPNGTTLTRDNFTQIDDGDDYTYETTYGAEEPGTYNGTLERAEATDGDVVTPDLTANATVQAPFNVTNLTATAAGGELDLSFDSTHTLQSVNVDITGAEDAALDLDAFSTNDSNSAYTYAGTYDAGTNGNYTVTLTEATADDGRTDDENLTDTATVGALLVNASIADATDADGVVNGTDRITIVANVSASVESVTADASEFGAGTVSLAAVDSTTHRTTVEVDASNATGERRVNVTATDGTREASEKTNALVVDTEPPTVDAGDNQSVAEGAQVTFSPATASDATTTVETHTWAFETGATESGETVTETFEQPGEYAVRLRVTDEAGNVGTDSLVVTVEENETTSGGGGVVGGGSGGSVSDSTTAAPTTAAGSTTSAPGTTDTASATTTSDHVDETATAGDTSTTTAAPRTSSTEERPPSHNVEMPFDAPFGITGAVTVLSVVAAVLLSLRRRDEG